jgi:hypothetical protein
MTVQQARAYCSAVYWSFKQVKDCENWKTAKINGYLASCANAEGKDEMRTV